MLLKILQIKETLQQLCLFFFPFILSLEIKAANSLDHTLENKIKFFVLTVIFFPVFLGLYSMELMSKIAKESSAVYLETN